MHKHGRFPHAAHHKLESWLGSNSKIDGRLDKIVRNHHAFMNRLRESCLAPCICAEYITIRTGRKMACGAWGFTDSSSACAALQSCIWFTRRSHRHLVFMCECQDCLSDGTFPQRNMASIQRSPDSSNCLILFRKLTGTMLKQEYLSY
jgi:hypothetical protein